MKRSILFWLLLFCFIISDCDQNLSEHIIIRFTNDIGIINNNTIQYNAYTKNEWKKKHYRTNIPNGVKNIFQIDTNIFGFIKNNKIQFYKSNFNNDAKITWERIINMPDFVLPDKYENVIMGPFYGSFCVIVNNELQLYLKMNSQEEDKITFSLPNGYKDVFIMNDTLIGIIMETDIVNIYCLNLAGEIYWKKYDDMEIILPIGYKYIFPYGYNHGIGIVFDNNIQFYNIGYDLIKNDKIKELLLD